MEILLRGKIMTWWNQVDCEQTKQISFWFPSSSSSSSKFSKTKYGWSIDDDDGHNGESLANHKSSSMYFFCFIFPSMSSADQSSIITMIVINIGWALKTCSETEDKHFWLSTHHTCMLDPHTQIYDELLCEQTIKLYVLHCLNTPSADDTVEKEQCSIK